MISLSVVDQLNVPDDVKGIISLVVKENIELKEQLKEGDDRLITTAEAKEILLCKHKKFWDMAANYDDFPKVIKFGRNYYRLGDVKAFRDKHIKGINGEAK
ncbi:hypothetical protein A7985_05500 [Pseudoalteromonas luteoviolacea]|uniref:Uncharacterized protein n=1 Tax=Pseudoalteromonas luteoviolacea TaxID=43657 RepID=A0A1C0TVP5_9GAMM|nr:hypothetical protein [Pseudoalteromonas luteoviolacea]OCQ23396.1 hypothetical protein A7985_05500 [Pseudoalteromonas luteoviolacea]TQF70473.1 hypothetical protein FLM44_05095 [Pseudoalteromonas luteoviolacea]